jgi:hypothetical protein
VGPALRRLGEGLASVSLLVRFILATFSHPSAREQMPANLPPQYHEAEKRYRAAKTPVEKIQALQEMLAIIPKHKGTDHLVGDLKRRMARHQAEAQKKGAGGKGFSLYIDREGVGQAVLVGLPNVGKSLLLNRLTHARSEVADYPFTTRHPHPGMVEFENVQIQLVDLPPVSPEHTDLWVFSLIRNADIVLLVVDLNRDEVGCVLYFPVFADS